MPAIRHPDHGPPGILPRGQLPDDRMLMQRKFSQFLASVAPVALGCAAGLCAATPAFADTTISTGTTQNLNTSTAGNVTISGTGTLTGTSGATVTVDSSNTATVNGGGTIYGGTASAPANGSIGILINPGNTTTITNGGTISVLENFTPTNINSGYVYSPVSGVSGRYGIYGAPGGTITGSISNTAAVTANNVTTTGSIYIDGEKSAGIELDSALNGTFSNEGNITVLGDNSYGIKLASVTGNVTVGGVVTATGSAAQGYVQAGDVTGVVLIDGAVSNGYSYTDTNVQSLVLARAVLNSGPLTGTAYLSVGTAPVVEIDGNVTGGVLINAPTTSTSTDTNRGSITAYGNNPALQIGGASNIVIGANSATDNGSLNPNTNSGSFALGIDGGVTANAYYSSTAAYGVVIGGRGGTVALTGGMEIYGSVTATTVDTAATAILINQGATVGTIFNSGSIKAAASQESTGNIYAIQDLSGTVSTVTNQGYISVTGATDGNSAALDLSHNTTGVTLTQNYSVANQTNETTDVSTTGYNPLTATLYAGITGDILLGTGTNTMTISSGSISGNTYFGLGSQNTVSAGDVTRWVGNITVCGVSDCGANSANTGNSGGSLAMTLNNYAQFTGTLNLNGATGGLTLNNNASFLGTITQGTNFDVTVNGGTFGANAVGTTTVRNLTVASGAALRVYVDGTTGTSSQLIANSATFASGAKISLAVNSLTNIIGNYDVLHATTLTGASALTTSSLNLPVLFNGTVTATANDVYVDITRATPAQLGLTTAQTAAYTAILNDASANSLIQNTLLGIYDIPTLRNRFNELLPNYNGGTFDVVTRATRIIDKHYNDDSTMFSISDSAAWVEPIVFRGTRTFGDTPGFKTTGGGLSMGVEKVTPVGNVGFQLAFVSGNASQSTINQSDVLATGQSVKSTAFELGLFWRKSAGPLYIWAGGNLGRESFKSSRTFYGQYTTTTTAAVTTTDFTYAAAGHWAGWSGSFNAGVSYSLPVGEHFSLRPRGVLEYDRLEENHYIESGDNPIALTVAGRTSSQTTATTTLLAQWSSGPSSHEGRPFAVEVEAGRRSWISGNLGTTTATFETGDTFSINGGHLPSAWVSNISILQGGLDYTWKIGTDIERGSDKGVAYGVRASISIAL
jgi:hypothetical protein